MKNFRKEVMHSVAGAILACTIIQNMFVEAIKDKFKARNKCHRFTSHDIPDGVRNMYEAMKLWERNGIECASQKTMR